MSGPRKELSESEIKELLARGYSPDAIAIMSGGPVGTTAFYNVLRNLKAFHAGCPHCGATCFGTGDCNCRDT